MSPRIEPRKYVRHNVEAFEGGRYSGTLAAGPGRILTLQIHDDNSIDTYYDVIREDAFPTLEAIFAKHELDPTRFYELLATIEPDIHTIMIDAKTYREADEK